MCPICQSTNVQAYSASWQEPHGERLEEEFYLCLACGAKFGSDELIPLTDEEIKEKRDAA